MSGLVKYESNEAIATLRMDDGKANVMSTAMLKELHDAFDRAESEKSVVILSGRENTFSAGFDLKTFASANANNIHEMVKLGAELTLRILTFPMPVIIACNGNALAMGSFLTLAADIRIGVDGPYKIGFNEVAIGLKVPGYAIGLASQRLNLAHFNRTAVTGELFTPLEAVRAGFLDHVVASDALNSSAKATALAMTKINHAAHALTKLRVRDAAIKAIRTDIDTEVTLENYQKMVAPA